jgi:hypothetical protein
MVTALNGVSEMNPTNCPVEKPGKGSKKLSATSPRSLVALYTPAPWANV